MDQLLPNKGESVDEIIGGALSIIQSTTGYRFSIDAFLLSHFVSPKTTDSVLDLGAGSGVVSLLLAYRYPVLKVVGVEIQEELANMAKRSVILNKMEERVEIICADIRKIDEIFHKYTFDIAVFNPPYRKLMSGRINSDRQKSVARHEIKGSLGDFLIASVYALKKAGRVYIIYPASRLVELLCNMRSHRIEPKKMQLIHSYPGDKGVLVLVEGIKAAREELEILPPFVIFEKSGNYTEETLMMFKKLSKIRANGVE